MKRYIETAAALVVGTSLFMGFACHAGDILTCPTLPGFDAVLKSSAPIIWFGEGHGTNEEPALFANAVCNTAASGQPVVVALEREPSEQRDLDEYMKSDGGPAARAKLLARKGDFGTFGRLTVVAALPCWPWSTGFANSKNPARFWALSQLLIISLSRLPINGWPKPSTT
jgi:hypothetical protein